MSSMPRMAQKTDPSFRFGAVAGRTWSGGECAVKARRERYGHKPPRAPRVWMRRRSIEVFSRDVEALLMCSNRAAT